MSGRNVGLIGLGAMGAGIARTLRKRGFEVHACDVRPGVAEAFGMDWTPVERFLQEPVRV